MSTFSNESHSQSTSSEIFPVEWPLTQENAGNRRRTTVSKATISKIRRGKMEYPSIVKQNQNSEGDNKEKTKQLYHHYSCSPGTANDEVGKCKHTSKRSVPNIFNSLDHEEASWLAKEINEANKSIFVVENAAKRFKQDHEILNKTKSSLCSLKSLLGDLRRSIRYPDEEIAKDLDTWDEASANFGVRNMTNCLGLLDNFFSELKKEMEK